MMKKLLLCLIIISVLVPFVQGVQYVYGGQEISFGSWTQRDFCTLIGKTPSKGDTPSVRFTNFVSDVPLTRPASENPYDEPFNSFIVPYGHLNQYYPEHDYYLEGVFMRCGGLSNYIYFPGQYDVFPFQGAKVIGNISGAPIYFVAAPQEGLPPLNTYFSIGNSFNLKQNSPVTWYFGDGESEINNNIYTNHTYESSGVYTVKLTGYNSTNSYFEYERENYINVYADSGDVTIYITNSALEPIEGALVRFNYDFSASIDDRTDSSGKVIFKNLPANRTEPINNNLEVFATGYAYYSEKFVFLGGNVEKYIILSDYNIPTSNNFIKVVMKDAQSNLFLEDVELHVYDFNSSENYIRWSMLGTEYITGVGELGNKPLIYGDSYMFTAFADGYIPENTTVLYNSGGQVVQLFLDRQFEINTSYELWVDVVDSNTGYTIGGAAINLFDNKYKEWKNKTSVTGQIAFETSGINSQYPIAVGRNYIIEAGASGYNKALRDIIFTPLLDKVPIVIPLTQLGAAPNGSYTIAVYCEDYTSGTPIEGVAIMLSNGQAQTTGYYGTTNIIAPVGGYTITASKSGYTKTSQLVSGSSGEIKSITIIMQRSSTVYPTLTPTPSPTLTYIGGQPIGEPAVCGISDGTIFGYMLAYIACWGADDRYTQNLILASLVIIVFMFFGARYGKGLGAAIGAAAGFVISVAMNLIPLWVFFAMVIITGLIFGLRLYTANK